MFCSCVPMPMPKVFTEHVNKPVGHHKTTTKICPQAYFRRFDNSGSMLATFWAQKLPKDPNLTPKNCPQASKLWPWRQSKSRLGQLWVPRDASQRYSPRSKSNEKQMIVGPEAQKVVKNKWKMNPGPPGSPPEIPDPTIGGGTVNRLAAIISIPAFHAGDHCGLRFGHYMDFLPISWKSLKTQEISKTKFSLRKIRIHQK